jgi:hypothetical protein
MGEFAKQVKNGKIYGPHTRKFMRGDWEATARSEDADVEDKRLAWAGIFFDDLRTHLRSEMNPSHLPLQPSAIARLAVGLATLNCCRITTQVLEKIPTPKPGATPTLMLSTLAELQVSVATGQLVGPDEVITAERDELKYLLAELQSLPASQMFRTEYDATRKDVDDISFELNKALMYSCALEYWLDCVGHGYGLTRRQDGVAHRPFDQDQEIARVVSIYRRSQLDLADKLNIQRQWTYQ